VTRQWDAADLEAAGQDIALPISMVRTQEEFAASDHWKYHAAAPLIQIEKIGESPPEPLPPASRPLAGVRAYGYCLTQYAHIVPAVLGREVKSVALVKELLARRYAEDLTLQELAAEAKLSRYHLIRAFHHATGLTPHAYLINQRIKAAKQRLRQGEDLMEIAAATGFSDQAHLTRVFKTRVGVTPGAYRAAVAP
jgi:AraC-like DNA-binding protein